MSVDSRIDRVSSDSIKGIWAYGQVTAQATINNAAQVMAALGGVSVDVLPSTNTARSLGSSILRWLNGYFSNLYVTNTVSAATVNASGTVSGATVTAVSALNAGGDANLSGKVYNGQGWEDNFGIWGRGQNGTEYALLKLNFDATYGGYTMLQGPNASPTTCAIWLARNGPTLRLFGNPIQLNGPVQIANSLTVAGVSVGSAGKPFAEYSTTYTGLPGDGVGYSIAWGNPYYVDGGYASVLTTQTNGAGFTGTRITNTSGSMVTMTVCFTAVFQAGGGGYRGILIARQDLAPRGQQSAVSSAAPTLVTTSYTFKLASTEYFDTRCFQNSGSALNVTSLQMNITVL